LTWSVWRVSPFITSIFFILGIFTLYEVLYEALKDFLKTKNFTIDDDRLNAWFGLIYMLIFIFGIQTTVAGTSISWQFMNFQLMGVVFCAYFLNIKVPYYYFIPVLLVFMYFDGSLGYWESWLHGIVLITFYVVLNYFRRRQKLHPFVYYNVMGMLFGALLWLFMKIKFNLPWTTYFEEWIYFVIFQVLLYSYVTMILRDSELKVRLTEFANHDALTKTQNFAAYTSEIKHSFSESKENQLTLSMMMFDIDHFKQVNDTYGHLAGDEVLRHTASVVQTVIDENDPSVKLYRTGGEEFNILFPGYDLPSTEKIVNQIFMAVNHLPVDVGTKKISISISVGVSMMSKKDVDPNDFYVRVDHNLYHSKKNGRSQITSE
jgi:diguanylate cyclase (GGDEF) domain